MSSCGHLLALRISVYSFFNKPMYKMSIQKLNMTSLLSARKHLLYCQMLMSFKNRLIYASI